MKNSTKVLVFTHIPSPYQVELFNSITENTYLDLTIAYIKNSNSKRSWKNQFLKHNHTILDDDQEKYSKLKSIVNDFDLIIFGYYQHPEVLKIMEYRCKTKKPWCFWGEPPGYSQFKLVGRLYRQWKLSSLHNSEAPIWGIGNWAVERYKEEFGNNRKYFNFPYFSDLDRFESSSKKSSKTSSNLQFLFSGSLTHRKGVDLLASCFARLAEEYGHIELNFLGEGVLRPALENQLSKYSQRVNFWGFQPWEDLPKFYQQADIFCFPSRYDGWGLVVPEALASGLPVIGTNKTGSALEFIKNGYNGWLIQSGDSESLYESMRNAIILSPKELQKYSDAAKVSVHNHSLSQAVSKFEDYVIKTIDLFD